MVLLGPDVRVVKTMDDPIAQVRFKNLVAVDLEFHRLAPGAFLVAFDQALHRARLPKDAARVGQRL